MKGKVERAMGKVARKVFPDHWSFLLGEIAMYSLAVLFATGIPLAFLFDASGEEVVYDGSYEALEGVEMSRAYASVLRISFDVDGGLLLRQTHHWAALVFTAAIVVHASRIFFTGAYRKPRRLNYTIGLTLLVLALTNGFFGVALPDDVLSGSGARIGYALALSLPLIGPGVAHLLVGGEFPNADMVHQFWVFHVFVIPAAILALFGAHMALVWRQTHTQLPHGRAGPDVVTGDRFWPLYLLRSLTLLCVVAALLIALGGLAQVNPIWMYGPFRASEATVPAGPDWYLMFVEGGLRVLPSLRIPIWGFEIPSPFVAGALIPAMFFGFLYLWPHIDARMTGDRDVHHILERPRDRPGRTALGVFGLTMYGLLTMAANHDYLGGVLGVDVGAMTTAFRLLLVIGPPVTAAVAWKVARDLASGDASAGPDGRPERRAAEVSR